ncbi:MAG: hypothetical protein ACOX2E_03295 [Syntrophaceticus sp.]
MKPLPTRCHLRVDTVDIWLLCLEMKAIMNGGQGAEGFRGLDKKIASKIQERSPDVVEYDGVSGVAYRFKKTK